MTTPNDELIAELQAESAEWTNDGNTRIPALLDRAIAALSQPAIPKTLGDTVALIVRDVCELEYPAHPDKPMLLTVSVNELSEILMDRLSQDAAIQQEPDEYQIRFCNSEGQFDSWKKCDKDFFYAHNDGKDDYAQTRVIYAHQQPAIQPQPDKAELTDARLTGLLFTNYGYLPTDEAIPVYVRMMRTAIAADRALRGMK